MKVSRRSRLELREAFEKLSKENLNIAASDAEKMHQVISDAIKEYRQFLSRGKWNQKEKEIENIFYDSLTKTYENTVKTINKVYKKVKDFETKDIFTLTYRKDGIELQERIKNYWIEGWAQLQDKRRQTSEDEELDIKLYLDYYLIRLLRNETSVVENNVKKIKKPTSAEIVIIEGICTCEDTWGGCECDDFSGEYPIGEEPDWPPFHPECTCIAYYDEVEEEDEQEALDIDEEDTEEEST